MTHATPTIHTALEDELDVMWRVALHLTNCTQTAETLVRRTFVCALERRPDYPGRRQMRSWLLAHEFRIWRQELRESGTGLTAVNDKSAPSMPGSRPAKGFPAGCFNGQLCDSINQLPEAQRLVILLVCVEEFSYADAAGILDVSVDTVISRLARARVAIGSQQQGRTPSDRVCKPASTVSMQAVSSLP